MTEPTYLSVNTLNRFLQYIATAIMATTTVSMRPLTTTFTRPSGCEVLTLQNCNDPSSCVATRPETICPLGTEPVDDLGGPGCFPSMISNLNGIAYAHYVTYSPGRICPRGMTTAASAISPDGVWCCPTYVGHLTCGNEMLTIIATR